MNTDSRPIDFGLTRLRLPLPGWVSILHRISGVLLFLALPLGVWALSTSLVSEAGFQAMRDCVQHPLVKLLAVALAWGFAHHFFAGLRHLAMDAHIGTNLKTARTSSIVVLLLSGLATLGFARWLLT